MARKKSLKAMDDEINKVKSEISKLQKKLRNLQKEKYECEAECLMSAYARSGKSLEEIMTFLTPKTVNTPQEVDEETIEN